MINAPALHIFICCTFSPWEPGLHTFTLVLTVFFSCYCSSAERSQPGDRPRDAVPQGHAAVFGVPHEPGFDVWAAPGLAGSWGPTGGPGAWGCADEQEGPSVQLHPGTPFGCPFPGASPWLSASCQRGKRGHPPASPPAALLAQPQPSVPLHLCLALRLLCGARIRGWLGRGGGAERGGRHQPGRFLAAVVAEGRGAQTALRCPTTAFPRRSAPAQAAGKLQVESPTSTRSHISGLSISFCSQPLLPSSPPSSSSPPSKSPSFFDAHVGL